MSMVVVEGDIVVAAKPGQTSAPASGVSTGVFYKARASWPDMVEQASRYSTQTIELSALHVDELDGLVEFCRTARAILKPFGTVSVHAPAKGIDGNDKHVCELLEQLPEFVDRIVLHPDVVSDWRPWTNLGPRLTVENMDRRKPFGCTVAELEDVFEYVPDAGMCLDLAHVVTMDPSLQLADEILDTFGDRLREVHVSSIDHDAHHVPLTLTDGQRFGRFVETCGHVPWIYEAVAD